ncbi:BACON domain-containing protein [Pedobacter sp. BS3]|uniref:BACON domain-containing protein n=1 Tax=Pedobacter sp. BS3 TaxID=2567937 RepID=UPI0011F0214A|nr:BACON domain-containing carbohydrate-binding protein [Pedobacter sp. BS3]TZF82236.1 BACON domain-containing protein [Pedobacter sp. BS3]
MKRLNILTNKWRNITLVIFSFITILGCQKDNLVQFRTDLALNARIIRLPDSATSTKIQVYSDNNWKVAVKPGDDWVTLDRTEGSGKSYITATVTSNKDNPARATEIYITAKGLTDTVFLQQKGIAQHLKFADRTLNATAPAGDIKTGLSTNIDFDKIEQKIKYTSPGQENWISNLTYDGTNLTFKVTQNSSNDDARTATIKLLYIDMLGATITDSILVTQNPKAAYDNAVLKDFNYVKNALGSGTITEDIYIEGIVLADKGNPNLALNPNKGTPAHTVDHTENAITVYVQSLDGTSGLKIRTKTPGDNLFSKNEKVKLWLKGATLSKTTNPNTATISDFPSNNIIDKVASSTPLIPREKYMRDLTDNDMYTYITLKDVEISVPFGTYYNTNYGYYARVDCYPTNIRDINGDSMYLLTNDEKAADGLTSLIRNGVPVPQGSGKISGVIVSENYPRYGGNIGKYSIRPLDRSEIVLNKNRDDGFSKVLVEWSTFSTTDPSASTIGTGRLEHSAIPENTSTGITKTTNYLGLTGLGNGTNAQKGMVGDAWQFATSWWNTAHNRGEAWIIKFSTKNISKQLSMQIEGNSDTGGPRNFIAEWSTSRDMDSGNWNYITEYTMEDVVNWNNTLITQVPGFKVVNFNLPIALLNQDVVYIRLRVKNKMAGSSTGGDSEANFTSNKASRLGHVSVKYNK